MTVSKIKYHINIPTSTITTTLKEILSVVTIALNSLKYNFDAPSAWVATEGAPGWRVSVEFNEPPVPMRNDIVQAVTTECNMAHIPRDGAITAWIHP